MAGTYWLTILPDTSKLKPAIQAAMRGEKITADFGVDEAKARKAGRDAAKAAESEASKAKPKVKPEADKSASRKAGEDAADESAKPVEQKRPKVRPKPDLPGSRKAGEEAGDSAAGGMIGSLRKLAPMIGGLSLLGGLKSSLSEGMAFTESLNVMQGVTSATGDQMARVSALAKQLGTDVSLAGMNANDAASAMTELAKGGMNAEEAMSAVKGTLALASAAGIGAAEAATIQSDALNIFQLQSTEATRVADLLTNAANASSSEVPQMAQALAQAGSAAGGFGISIEDTLTSLAMFSNFGIKGSDAGTLMKASLLAITDGGKPAQEAMQALGLELYNANREFVGYPEMLRQVAEASKRMSEEQFQGATAVLFGSDAMRGAMVAANGGAEAFNTTADQVVNGAGAIEMGAKRMQGLPGAWGNFTNAIDGVKMSIYELIQGPMTGLLNGLAELPAFVSRNADAFKIAAGVITTLLVPALVAWTVAQAKAIGTSIIGAVTALIGSWTAMAGAIMSAAAAAGTYAIAIARGVAASIVSGLTAMVAAFRNLAIGTRLAAAAQAVFNVVMMANPIGLIVAAVAAVTVGLIYFFTQTEIGQKIWRGFTEYLKKAWDSLKDAFRKAWDFIGNIWDSMVTKAGEVWDSIKTKFTNVVDFVKGLPAKIGNAAKGMWDGISNAFKGMIDKLKGWWNGFASRLSWTSPKWLPGDPVTFSLPTFSRGGYTGNVAATQVAGVVHGGEYVIKASSRERLENMYPHLLDYLNKTGRLPGYYGGGRVALGNISGAGITTAEQQSMWDAIRSAFPDAVLSSATRTVMTEGHPDFHNAGRAIDLTGPNMGAMAAWIAENYPDSLELIYSPFGRNIKNGRNVGNGMDYYGAGTMAAHQDHVHWALGRNAEGSKVGAGASSSSSGGGSSVGSSTSSSGGGSYRAATASELKTASGKVATANKAVTQAQQRVDDRTFTRDRAQQRLDTARAEGKDTVDEEESLRRANRELDDATQNLAEKREKLAEVEGELADLQSTGKWVEDDGSSAAATVSDSMTAAGGQQQKGPNTGDLGQMFVGGLLESFGLDGTLFSNPMEWPSVKSLMAGINWAGGLLSIAGATPESMGAAGGGGTAGGFAAGAADAVGLGGLLSAIPSATEMATRSGSPALAPGEFNPAVAGGTAVAATPGMSTFAPAPHGGSGAAPGPAVDNSININGNVGMSPDALQTKLRTEQNARTRTTVIR